MYMDLHQIWNGIHRTNVISFCSLFADFDSVVSKICHLLLKGEVAVNTVPLCHKVCMACNVCVGYEKCVLVGHDWGGAVAWSYAAVHPEHVECLIACNIPHPTAFKKHLRSTSSQARKSWYVFVSFHVIIIIINSNNNHNFLKWPQDNCNYCGDHWKMQGS